MEIKILASVIESKSNWDIVAPHLTDDDLTPEGILVWNKINQFYTRDTSSTCVDMEVLENRVIRHVEHNAKQKASMEAYMIRLKLVDVSSINIVAEVLEQKSTLVGVSLADALLAQDKPNIGRLMEELQQLNAAVDLDIGVEEEHIGTDVHHLITAFAKENLIGVSPPSLNKRLDGGAVRGHHILIVARPEAGKTAVALQMTSGFVQQGYKVLYLCNEDPVVSIVFRFMNNLTGLNKYEIVENPDEAMRLAVEHGYNRAVFTGLSPGTLPEIRSLISKHKPDVLVVDQLRNIQVKSENRTNQLEAVARGMRDFARQYNLLAVSVTQAADSANNKLVLDMGDVDGSNTGIPGACDVMLMMGVTPEYANNNQRMFTLAKNKLSGTHASWPVGLDGSISRIIDPAEFVHSVQNSG